MKNVRRDGKKERTIERKKERKALQTKIKIKNNKQRKHVKKVRKKSE
jgi:hypothetical protein